MRIEEEESAFASVGSAPTGSKVKMNRIWTLLNSDLFCNILLGGLALALLIVIGLDYATQKQQGKVLTLKQIQDSDGYKDFFKVKYTEEEKAEWRLEWRLQEAQEHLRMQKKMFQDLFQELIDTTDPFGLFAFLNSPFVEGGNGNKVHDEHLLQHDLAFSQQTLLHIQNTSSIYTIGCIDQKDRYLRVGANNFNTKEDMVCKVHGGTMPRHGVVGPQYLWEVVVLEGATVAFRSLSNGLFLRIAPPGLDFPRATDWNTETVSPIPGKAERFQIWYSHDLKGTLIFSELLKELLACPKGGVLTPLRGRPDIAFSQATTATFTFHFSSATPEQIQTALDLKDLSRDIQILYAQNASHVADASERRAQLLSTSPYLERASIAIAVPVTSKGTQMYDIEDSPFWFHTFQTFCFGIDWSKDTYNYTFYLGFDKGDSFYDTGDSWNELRKAFRDNAEQAITWMGGTDEDVSRILRERLFLKLSHFESLEGAPSQIVNGLMKKAYNDGHDYFYQINDDTELDTKNWAKVFIKSLATNPVYPNLGVTGPVDSRNPKIFTHAFTHRTHLEIFGNFFPLAFKNWWSDDWISTVYGEHHTFRQPGVTVTHNVKAQKSGSWNRYKIDYSAQFILEKEIQTGFITINRFLEAHGAGALHLPVICGYTPAVDDILAFRLFSNSSVRDKSGNG